MIFSFLLAAGLDFALPEFQPETDLSGNYIVSGFDVSSGEITFEELEALPDGLTVGERVELYDSFSLSSNFFEKDEIVEPVFNRDGSGSVSQSTLANTTIDTTNLIIIRSPDNGYSHYLTLNPGYTYTITTDAPRIFLADSLEWGTSLTVASSNIISPSQTIYAIVGGSRTISATFVFNGDNPDDPSGNDPGSGDFNPQPFYDYYDKIIILLRSILFVSLWKFILPILMKIRDHVFNLKHE